MDATFPRAIIKSALSISGVEARLVEDYARWDDGFVIEVVYCEDVARIVAEILFELEDGTYNQAARRKMARDLADSLVISSTTDETFAWALCFPGWKLEG